MGKRVSKWHLVLVLSLIGWKSGGSFLDQSQSEANKNWVNMVFFRYTIEIFLQQQEKNELIFKLGRYREIRDLKY